MNKYLLLISCVLFLFSCNDKSKEADSDPVYPLLEKVAELNVGGEKSAAIQLADSALALNPADTTRCWLLSEKTVALTDMGRMGEAIHVGHQTIRLAEQLEDVEATLNMRGAMGIAYRRLGKLDSALVEYQKGIEYAVKKKNTEYEIYLNNCIAVMYSESNRFDEALIYARKAEKSALMANDTIERLSAVANIGGIYLRNKQYQKSLDVMLPLWKVVQKVDYNVLTLKCLSVILKDYVGLDDNKSVAKYMAYADRAMQGMSLTSNGVLGIVEVKADLLASQGKYLEQKQLLDSLLSTNAKNRVMPQERLLYKKALCLEHLNRKDEAWLMMGDAYRMQDSVKQGDIEKNMSEFTVKYQTLEKEKGLEQARREKLEMGNRLLWLGIFAALLLVAVCVLLYRRKVARQRAELQERRSYIQGLETERERMAKELHDGVCNDILAVTLLLATDREKADRQLRTIWKDVRHLSHALMPPRFEKIALDEAVKCYVQTIVDDAECQVKLNIDGSFDWSKLSPQQAYDTYRIIQEAVSNAMKHGNPTSLVISLQVVGQEVSLLVSNEGEGSLVDAQPYLGIGVETMQRRAASIGAKLSINHEHGKYAVALTYRK